jgi:hypothetical protein
MWLPPVGGSKEVWEHYGEQTAEFAAVKSSLYAAYGFVRRQLARPVARLNALGAEGAVEDAALFAARIAPFL